MDTVVLDGDQWIGGGSVRIYANAKDPVAALIPGRNPVHCTARVLVEDADDTYTTCNSIPGGVHS